MRNAFDTENTPATPPAEYEIPELTVIGSATRVILGVPGIGFDGPNGYTEVPFEFEPDGGD